MNKSSYPKISSFQFNLTKKLLFALLWLLDNSGDGAIGTATIVGKCMRAYKLPVAALGEVPRLHLTDIDVELTASLDKYWLAELQVIVIDSRQ